MASKVKLLAFDTSSLVCSVALLDTAKDASIQMTSSHKVLPMQQGRLILPMIQELLSASSLTLNELDAIAYGSGPGSFTGIRIASSVAQGIGFATRCKVFPISSLAAIAQTAYLEQQWDSLLVALDARMNEVYWAQYVVNADGYVELNGEEEVCAPEKIKISPQKEGYGVGEGWGKYADTFTECLGYRPVSINSTQFPKAESIALLAKFKFDQGDKGVGAFDATPVYLR